VTSSVNISMENRKPLEGKTIVITRARHQAPEFTYHLTNLGARVVEFPTIEIVPPDSWGPLDEATDHLHDYDWIIFTSANGVRSFVNRFRVRGKSSRELKDIRICAIGPRTARELEQEGIEVHLIPSEYRAESVVENLAREGLMGKRVLLARAKTAREVLPRELRNRGARVDVVATYQTVQPRWETSQFLSLLEERRVDAIAFTSSSTVQNFMEMFCSKRDELLKGLEGVVIAAIGPVTERRAVELGLTVHLSPSEYTIPALSTAMAEYFGSRR